MKSSISRSAAWLFHYTDENPNEVAAARDDNTEALIRELKAQHNRSGFAVVRVKVNAAKAGPLSPTSLESAFMVPLCLI